MVAPFEEAWRLRYSEPDKALKKAEAIAYEAVAKRDRTTARQAELIRLFIRFMRHGNKELVADVRDLLHYFQEQELPRESAITHDLLARLADAHGEYARGMEEVLKGLEEAGKVNDRELYAELLATKGNLLNRTGANEQAIKELERCLTIRQELRDDKAIASALNLLARSHTLNEAPDKALSYYERSRELRERIGDEGALPWTYLGIATAHEKKGSPDRSLDFFDKALENDQEGGTVLKLLVKAGKGRVYLQKKAVNNAVSELEKARELADELGSEPLKAEVLDALYKAEKEAGRTESALEHLERYNRSRERIIEESNKDRMRHQEQAFQAEKKEKEAEIERLRNVELKKAYDELEEKNKEIRDSLNYASRIQTGLLPEEESLSELFPEHFVLFRPRDIVSGDFYWAGRNRDREGTERRYLVAADCTGHGVPGAFMSMLGVTFLNELILEKGFRSPAEILDQLRRRVVGTLNPRGNRGHAHRKDGMDLTLIAHEPGTRILDFAGANNPLYLIRRKDRPSPQGYDRTEEGGSHTLYEFKVDRQPVGASEEQRPFTETRIALEEGDRVHLLSDGYPDQFGGDKGKKFKYKRLKERLLDLAEEPMASVREQLDEDFESWRDGHEQVDDVVLCGLGFWGVRRVK